MLVDRLDRMVRGWLIGDFDPSVMRTRDFEFGVKSFKAGDYEPWHYHKIATEITVILDGKVSMNCIQYISGDVIVLDPSEGTDFRALTDVTTVVVKIPGANDDKYTRIEE